MKIKQKRWMASVLATSRGELPALPFQRGNRKGAAARIAPSAPRLLRRA